MLGLPRGQNAQRAARSGTVIAAWVSGRALHNSNGQNPIPPRLFPVTQRIKR